MLRRFRCNYRGCLIVFNVLKAAWLRHFPCCAYIDGAVDPAARDYILSTIIRNYAEDAALVLSTHLIGDIENVLDDALFLQNGRVALAGSVDALRAENGKSVDALFREVFKCSGNY